MKTKFKMGCHTKCTKPKNSKSSGELFTFSLISLYLNFIKLSKVHCAVPTVQRFCRRHGAAKAFKSFKRWLGNMTLQNVKYREIKVSAGYSVTQADIDNIGTAGPHSVPCHHFNLNANNSILKIL